MINQGEESGSPTRFADLAYQVVFSSNIGAVECYWR